MPNNNEKFKHRSMTDEAYIYPAMPRDTTTPRDTIMLRDKNRLQQVIKRLNEEHAEKADTKTQRRNEETHPPGNAPGDSRRIRLTS